MVQRKFPDKLGIQVDSKNKSERKAKPIKSYSSQHTDIRNKGGGTELTKKIMKKSRTFKLSDPEVLGSSSLKRLSMPSVDVVTPEKKPNSIKISENSPNYMKSTNSSNAKKECTPASPYSSTKTSYEKMNQNRSDAKELRSGSDQKKVKSLTKTSSLKPVKTLTKTSIMKVVRHSKKSSEIALNQKQNAGRATCSSTLKDSKFPQYVIIHPEGAESEGTSVMKVCPYTYCSLNGHCHSPLPPLNSFLSARRRSLRAQKSMKHKITSPAVGTKPSGDSNGEIDTGKIQFSSDPELVEEDTDFFVEIYAKPRKDTDELNGNNEAGTDFSTVSEVLEDVSYSVKTTKPEKDRRSTAETPPDKSSYFEFEDPLCRDSDFLMAKTYLDHSYQNELEGGTPDESELNESMSEASDMDWDERRLDTGLQDELIFKLDDIFSNYSRYVPANRDEFHTEYKENIDNFNARFDDDSDYDDRDQISAIDVSSNIRSVSSDISNSPSLLEHYSSTEDASDEPTTIKEETYGDAEPNGFVNIGISPTSENPLPLEEPKAFDEEISGVYETENGFLEIQSLASCRVFHEIQQDSHKEAQYEGYKARTEIEVCQFDSLIEVETCGEVLGEGILQTHVHPYDESDLLDMVEKDVWGRRDLSCLSSATSEKQNDVDKLKSCEEVIGSDEKMHTESSKETDAAETLFKANNLTGRKVEQPIINAGIDSHQQTSKSDSNLKRLIKVKQVEEEQELRPFNPREPRYLPVEPDPEKEKVDLRHQMMDERKNTEEWMLDYALRQTVTKLAPARKKKVALLVEAFETIKPLPKYENHPQQPRPVQACR